MKTQFLCLLVMLMTLLSSAKCLAQQLPINDVSKSLPCVDKNFNIRVIMTVDSTTRQPLLSHSQVDSILVKASEYFTPICMSFSSCSHDILENYSYNKLSKARRIEEMGIVYHYPRRITLFFVNEVYGNNCGHSYYDGLNSRNKARIYVELFCQDSPAVQIAHHVGSLLGLLETNHSAATELVNGSNCATAGDEICDTPADPYGVDRDTSGQWMINPKPNMNNYVDGCNFKWLRVDNKGEFYNPMTTNIMSPYHCKCSFTRGQFLRMVDNYNKSNYIKY